MIADDEIAIVGSANVNQRSFTYDSETCVIVFDERASKHSFASKIRRKITADMLRSKKDAPAKGDLDMFAAQGFLPAVINNEIVVVKDESDIKRTPNKNGFILSSALLHTKDRSVALYKSDANDDLDDKILLFLSNMSVGGHQLSLTKGSVTLTVGGRRILDKFVITEASIVGIFDALFDTVIDPKLD